jgi:hypothetical protein
MPLSWSCPLVLEPKRIVALGLTWRSHARETGETITAAGPAVFERDPASLAAGDRVVIPSPAHIRRVLDAVEPGLGDELTREHRDVPVLFEYEIYTDRFLERWGKLRAAVRSARKPGDAIEMEVGPLGSSQAVIEEERP